MRATTHANKVSRDALAPGLFSDSLQRINIRPGANGSQPTCTTGFFTSVREMDPSINVIPVERYWFLTWTTYGSWLPGDRRGYTGTIIDESGRTTNQNKYGTPSVPPNHHLADTARQNLKSRPVVLSLPQAEQLLINSRKHQPIANGY
jgi:hypothetical protein